MILETGQGEFIPEPDDKSIKRIVLKTFKKKEDNFVVINDENENYIQARPMSESIDELGCRFEYRDSNIQKHFAASNVPQETVTAVLQKYNRGDQKFRKAVEWLDISDEFEWKSPSNAEDLALDEQTKDIISTIKNVYADHEAKQKRRK
jgi:hypothetical protein